MRNSFIFGVVWLAIIIGILSFGFTVFFLEDSSKEEEASSISQQIKEEKDIVYETNQTAIRTNEMAYLGSSYELNGSNSSNSNTADRIVEKDVSEENKENEMTSKLEENKENEVTNKLEENKVVKNENELDDKKENKEDTVETASSTINSFVRPVKGEVLRPFSPDELIYSKTLAEWSIHQGTDYKAKIGEEVVAILSGTIKQVGENDKYGEFIIIEHTDGYESLCANLTVLDALREGNKVEQGQLIGYVAESFGFEVAEETHLHFELKKDGEFISI